MGRDLPSLNAVRMFEAAARFRNFTKAAEALCVTQGAVSRQIKHLEADLGQDLFTRDGPKVELTEAGEHLYRAATEALSILRRSTLELKRLSGGPILTISVLPSFASKWLIHRIPDFQKAVPNVELRFAASYEAIDFRQHADIDLAIRFGEGGWADVYSECLFTERVFPVASPALLSQLGSHPSPTQLAKLPLLYASEDYDQWDDWFAAVGVTAPQNRGANRFSDITMLLQAAIDGQGVALARSLVAAQDLESGLLKRPFEVSIPSKHSHYFVCRNGQETERHVEQFLDWIRAEARKTDSACEELCHRP